MAIPNFDEIRPYSDAETPAAIERIAASPYFPYIVRYIFPKCDVDEVTGHFRTIKSVHDFQFNFMRNAVNGLLSRSIEQLTSTGIGALRKDVPYLFLSNHRDIMLDATILMYELVAKNIAPAEITFGSNLMTSQLVIDIGKLNKMFKFQRSSGSAKKIVEFSQQNSAYIRYALLQKKQSIWIAQRNGRTKNGCDKTDVGVLKMLAMSSSADFVRNMAELNIVPVSISYEFEPCDFRKTREVYISSRQKYVKAPNEDFESILQGVVQRKGNVNISVCEPISVADLEKIANLPRNDRFKQLASIIDSRIYGAYKLWPNSYIAYDLLNKSDRYVSYYTALQKEEFIAYAQKGLSSIEGDRTELEGIFYGIYANPVKKIDISC